MEFFIFFLITKKVMLRPFATSDISKGNVNGLMFPRDVRSQRAQVAANQLLPEDPSIKSLSQEILVQIVSLENISTSKRDQLDELLIQHDIESVGADRHRFAGQTLVRNVDVEGDQQQDNVNNTGYSNINYFFKLTLQDTSGKLAFGLEIEKLSFLSSKNLKSGFPIQLGSKLLLKKNCEIEEGVILLNRSNVDFLGGLVPEWNNKLSERHIVLLQDQLNNIQN